MAQRDEWINIRMERIFAHPFCPKCHVFLEEHDDKACDMRYTLEPEEVSIG